MIEKARMFAMKAHQGQKRKISNEDYIVHPIRVADLLKSAGYQETVISAGYLHDVVEDTSYSIDDIEREFGNEVKHLVQSHTEDKTKPWIERKRHTIDTVQSGSEEIKALIIADKLDNLQSLNDDLKKRGDEVWQYFNAGYEKQKWYNQSIAEVMEEGLSLKSVPPFFETYRSLVNQTFD